MKEDREKKRKEERMEAWMTHLVGGSKCQAGGLAGPRWGKGTFNSINLAAEKRTKEEVTQTQREDS